LETGGIMRILYKLISGAGRGADQLGGAPVAPPPIVHDLITDPACSVAVRTVRKVSQFIVSRRVVTLDEAIAAFNPDSMSTERKSGPQTMAALQAIKDIPPGATETAQRAELAHQIVFLMELYEEGLDNVTQLDILKELKKTRVIDRQDGVNAMLLYLKERSRRTMGMEETIRIDFSGYTHVDPDIRCKRINEFAKLFGMKFERRMLRSEDHNKTGLRMHKIGDPFSTGEIYHVLIKPEGIKMELIVDRKNLEGCPWVELFIGAPADAKHTYTRGAGDVFVVNPEQQIGVEEYLYAKVDDTDASELYPDHTHLYSMMPNVEAVFKRTQILDIAFQQGLWEAAILAGRAPGLDIDGVAEVYTENKAVYNGATLTFDLSRLPDGKPQIEELKIVFDHLPLKPEVIVRGMINGRYKGNVRIRCKFIDEKAVTIADCYMTRGRLSSGTFTHYEPDADSPGRLVFGLFHNGRLREYHRKDIIPDGPVAKTRFFCNLVDGRVQETETTYLRHSYI
jgi:hypothetical protein